MGLLLRRESSSHKTGLRCRVAFVCCVGLPGGSLALRFLTGDFMSWPGWKHRFGWFVEPAYDYSFARGHQQSIGMSCGLLIGIW